MPDSEPSAATYLQLILEGQPAAAFEEPLAAARAHGDETTVREVEQTRLLALRVKDELDGLKSRQAVMHSLYQSFIDLASLRDPDEVLNSIVERARRLLDCDGAEIHVTDDVTRESQLRAASGNIKTVWYNRTPAGDGLAGLVAQTAAPQMTESYLTDRRFKHTKRFDEAMRAEQITAALGVPLKLGSRVVGVLMVSYRGERTFTSDDISLLSSLAIPAAISMETASLLADSRRALAELAETRDQLAHDAAALEREGDAHDRLVQVTLDGGGVAEVAVALEELLGGSVVILDRDDQVIAQSAVDPVDPLTEEDWAAVSACRKSHTASAHRSGHVAPMMAGSQYLGAVHHRTPPESDREEFAAHELRTVERAAVVCTLLLLFQQSLADAESRLHDELLDDLLRAPIHDSAELKSRLHRAGMVGEAYCVLTATPKDAVPRGHLSAAARAAASQSGALATLFGHEVVLLVASDDASSSVDLLAKSLEDHLGQEVFAASSDPFDALDEAPEALQQAQRCLSAMKALGSTGGMSSRELGFLGLLLGDPKQAGRFVHDTLGAVLDYDARRGTDLVETLEVYFATGRSVGQAATALTVHPNTVTQRLGRVRELLGEDCLEPGPSLELQLALHVHRCIGA